MIENGYQMYRPTFGEKVTRALGFRRAPHVQDWKADGLVESGITTGHRINLSFADRLRVLIRGKVELAAMTKTNCIVDHAETRSEAGVPW